MNKIRKCKIVDILTETQYMEMYGRIENQNETYNKYMEKSKMILILGIRENK